MRVRPRRNRKMPAIRSLVREVHCSENDLMMPFFVQESSSKAIPISSMPGQYRHSLDSLIKVVGEFYSLGGKAIALFPVVEESLKNSLASESYNPNNLNHRAIRAIKESYPDMVVMGDIALDPYSSDGHDGLVDPQTGEILNDPTLDVLGRMALCQAEAGVDVIGPSDMMDGRVGHLRDVLDAKGMQHVSIMSYSVKYASHCYGPFRDALDSAPKAGDKKTYQMDFSNAKEAVREALLDIQEGADMVMVKPGLAYLDIIARLNSECHIPVAAYQVSGEYAMIKAAAQNGWIDEQGVVTELLTSFKRAGADIILSYYALDFLRWRNR